MTARISEYRRLFHSTDDLYELITDISTYPDFIPQITAMRILKEKREDTKIDLTAEARIRFKFISESFTSRVLGDSEAKTIDVAFVSGPFRKLDNKWRFHALSDGSTLVEFHIVAAFKNPVLQMLLDNNKDRAAKVLISRFQTEANHRYAISGDPDMDMSDEINAFT